MAKLVSEEGGAGSPGQARLLEIAPMAETVRETQPAIPAKGDSGVVVAEGAASTALIEKPAESPAPAKKPRSRRMLILAAVLAVVIGTGAYFGHEWWTVGRFMVSTDDAYVGADTATLSPKIAGYVKLVPVADNAFVTAGTPLVILDDADYQVALRQANAQVATQQATIDRIGEQMKAAAAQIDSATAQLSSATAAAGNAKSDYDRVSALLGKGFSTQKDADAARTALAQANAAGDAASAALNAAKANAGVVAAQKTEAERVLAQYRLAAEQAQLNLDHTIIRAPFDGTVGNRAAEPGEFVAAGTRLLALVPANVYVDANFKETQLDRLTAGQSVTVTVDAYPDHPFKGVVESVAPASGSSFSLLPPDNATGNFTKIVQRVPVRIRLSDSTANGLVRPGMSVVADVDTRHAGIGVALR